MTWKRVKRQEEEKFHGRKISRDTGKNNGVPTFRIYQKYPLPVNMAVDINKLEIQDKTDSLLSKNTKNMLTICGY